MLFRSTDDSEKRIAVSAFFPPGKTNLCPGGRVGSSSCARLVIGMTANIMRQNRIVICLNTNPALMKTQSMYRYHYAGDRIFIDI